LVVIKLAVHGGWRQTLSNVAAILGSFARAD